MTTSASAVLDDSVARTLFIPLWAKAREMSVPGGILRDEAAAKIVAMLPPETFNFPKKKPMMVGSVVRTRYFDDIAVDALKSSESPVLVHLGCGLDDRFGRTDFGKGVQVNIDLPEVMALRQTLMPPESDRNINLTGSLLETGWMDTLLDMYPKADFSFFVEGVLMYFTEDNVKTLATNLATRFPGGSLHFDACNSRMCKLVGNQKAIRQAKATFKWGMDDDCVLEQWHQRFHHIKTQYYFDMYHRRWGLLSLMRFVPRFGRGSKMLSYRIAA